HANSSSSRHFYFCFHFFAPSFCTAEFSLSPIQLRRQTVIRSQPHVLFLGRRHGHLRQRLNLRRNFRHQCLHVLRHPAPSKFPSSSNSSANPNPANSISLNAST